MMGSPYDISVLFQSKLMEAGTTLANGLVVPSDKTAHEAWQDKTCKCLLAGSTKFPGMEKIESCSIMVVSEEDPYGLLEKPARPSLRGVDSAMVTEN
jgi:hypothetical protein